MTEPASLIGFGLCFLAAAWAASAALCGGVLLARRPLERLGPAAERAAAAMAVVMGPLAGIAVVAALAGHSVLAAGSDHCPEHLHHPHLCVAHGGAWADQPWAVATLAMVGTFVAVRVTQKLVGLLHARRALRRLAGVVRPVGDGVFVAPAGTSFCFVAGLIRPRIYVSSTAWAALDADERRAVIAHERAHIAHGDLARRALLGLAALVGAPLLASRALAAWGRATERLCDRHATRTVAPSAVAQALVSLSRAGSGPAPAGLAFGAGSELVARVEAVLAGGPTGRLAARRMSLLAGVLLLATTVAAVAFAAPLHHLAETFLGVL